MTKNRYDVLTRTINSRTWNVNKYNVSLIEAMQILSKMTGKNLEFALRLTDSYDTIAFGGIVDAEF